METLMLEIKRFLREEEGVTAIEYGLLAALIAVAIIVGAALLGDNLNTLFNNIATCISSAPTATGCTF